MIKATNAKYLILACGSISEIINKNMKITICIDNIQLRLAPNLFKIGIENLSTNGAQRNFNEYVRLTQVINPIKLKSTPISLSHAVRVITIRT